jgi:GntR family transcriptional regulator/MocR family aminotransferase
LTRQTSIGSLIAFTIDPSRSVPVYQQLYRQMRTAIVSGRLSAKTRLPASRVLAQELGLSRNTVLSALDLLNAEGYVVSRIGDGTYVAGSLPEDRFLPREAALRPANPLDIVSLPALSERGRLLTQLSVTAGPQQPIPFVADIPAFDAFPLDAWASLMTQSWRQVKPAMLGYADPAGYEPLRDAIAQHLRAARHLRCTAKEIIVMSGSQQSLDLLARVLIDPGEAVWVEEPGYVGARGAFIAAGARLVPVPVDRSGLNVEAGIALEPNPRLIFISPSRQHPLGVTMSLERRQDLLAFAERSGAWIIEDDYDSEFRYRGSPLPAVQSLDRSERVIYLGTFSKTLLPSFRLGFMAVPETLAAAFANAKGVIDRHPPLLEQMTLLEFMRKGQFAAHVRRMRRLYEDRQTVLIEEIEAKTSGFLRIEPADTGMHLIGYLPPGVDDLEFCAAARAKGISLRPLSACFMAEPRQSGVILGFAAIPPKRIRWGVEQLAAVIDDLRSGAGAPPPVPVSRGET